MTVFDPLEISRRTHVRFVEYHARLDSTNKLATELRNELHQRAPALVLTEEQTAGRGRGTNSWWSSSGALAFSLVLDAKTHGPSTKSQPLMSLAAGLAVRSTLAKRLSRQAVQIKWPNDVLVDDRKISGILCEHHVTNFGTIFVIGIGINANNALSAAPDDIRVSATSLFDLTGDSVSLTDLLVDVLRALDHEFLRLRENAADIVRDVAVHDRLTGHNVVIDTPTQTVRGFCRGIASDGALLLHTDSGSLTIRTGTVRSF